MEYRTADGVKFFVLPDGARCSYTRKHPDNMDTCPLKLYDDLGMICIPEQCGYYNEHFRLTKEYRENKKKNGGL